MDQDLKDYLDQMGRRLSGLEDAVQQTRTQLQGEIQQTQGQLQGEIQQVRGQLQDEIRQIRILVERQSDDIRQVAKGVVGTYDALDSFQAEVAQQFEQMRSFVALPYRDVDRRIKLLESWKERTDRDPVEIIRELYGRPKSDKPT